MPSLTPVWPGADFQEREVYDMMGIRFAGHPNLRRILLWEGFEGYPLRKDYKEPYYEEEFKPSRAGTPTAVTSGPKTACRGRIMSATRSAWDPDLWTSARGRVPPHHGRRRPGNEQRRATSGPSASWSTWDRSTQHARRVPHGHRHRGRERRRAGAGDGLPAPLPREDRRAQHLHHEHPVHRPAGLHHAPCPTTWAMCWRSRS